MANHEWESDSWVDAQISSLADQPGWKPNADRALMRLRRKAEARGAAARRWAWTMAVATAFYLALFLAPASRACAQEPGACVLRVLGINANAQNPVYGSADSRKSVTKCRDGLENPKHSTLSAALIPICQHR